MIRFIEETHQYFDDKGRLPSVTEILSGSIPQYTGISEQVLENASARGQAVHRACELYDKNELDYSTLDEQIIPYLEAWISFIKDTGFIVGYSEQIVYSNKFRYAGTLDRIGKINGESAIVDIKTTAILSPVTGLQLAGYKQAAIECLEGSGQEKRFAVQLKDNGNYSIKEYTDQSDFNVFLSCLQLYQWKLKNET